MTNRIKISCRVATFEWCSTTTMRWKHSSRLHIVTNCTVSWGFPEKSVRLKSFIAISPISWCQMIRYYMQKFFIQPNFKSSFTNEPLNCFTHNIPNCMKEVTWLKYKWAPISWSGVAAFHLAACVCTSSNDKELIGADKDCVLTHAYH